MATINSINTEKPVEVASGGQGNSTLTAYAVLCGGTTTTGPIQSIASVGTANQVLTSNGAASLPTFQAAAGGGSLVLIETQTASSSSSLDFTTGISSTYTNYLVEIVNILPSSASQALRMQVSDDAGSTWKTTTYYSGINYHEFNSTTLTNINVNNGAHFQLSYNLATTVPGIYIDLVLFDISNGNKFNMAGKSSGTTGVTLLSASSIVGFYNTAITVTGLRFIMASGNIASGQISLYGFSD